MARNDRDSENQAVTLWPLISLAVPASAGLSTKLTEDFF